MSNSASWIPIEWPAEWGPQQVSLLRDTPFNAVVFRSAPPAGVADAVRAAGLATPAVNWREWKKVDWTSAEEPLAVSDGFWPAFNWKNMADAQAAPTGEPWLDANGWLYLYGRSRSGGKAIWVRSDPPADPRTVRVGQVQLLLAEAFAYGGRRPVWLPPLFAKALAGGNSRVSDDFAKTAALARWFEAHGEWRSWPAVSPLALVSDFSEKNEYVAGEAMLLSARQQTPFWPLYSGTLKEEDLRNRRAVLYLDADPPKPQLLGLLDKFVRTGGLLIISPSAAKGLNGLKPVSDAPHPRFKISSLGRGRVAVGKTDFDDPWTVAGDAHLLTSRRYDPSRLFNGGLLHLHHSSSLDARRSLIHVVNYTAEPQGHVVVLQVSRPVQSALIHSPNSTQPVAAKITGTANRPEIVLPYFSVYIAVELEHAHA